jgi:protein transport protein SEC13
MLHGQGSDRTLIQAQISQDSGHDDMIVSEALLCPLALVLIYLQHDAVLDYYGRRLATCSSDKTIKIFEIDGDQRRLTETLKG